MNFNSGENRDKRKTKDSKIKRRYVPGLLDNLQYNLEGKHLNDNNGHIREVVDNIMQEYNKYIIEKLLINVNVLSSEDVIIDGESKCFDGRKIIMSRHSSIFSGVYYNIYINYDATNKGEDIDTLLCRAVAITAEIQALELLKKVKIEKDEYVATNYGRYIEVKLANAVCPQKISNIVDNKALVGFVLQLIANSSFISEVEIHEKINRLLEYLSFSCEFKHNNIVGNNIKNDLFIFTALLRDSMRELFDSILEDKAVDIARYNGFILTLNQFKTVLKERNNEF